MGYLGFQTFLGDADTGSIEGSQSAGPRLGGMFGFYVSPEMSLNVDLSLDIPNDGSGSSSISRFGLSFAPLYHIDQGLYEIVLGPKLGFWETSFSDTDDTLSGWQVGLNAGAFYHLGRVGLGGLVTFDYAHLSSCTTTFDGDSESCSTAGAPADKILSFNVAVLL